MWCSPGWPCPQTLASHNSWLWNCPQLLIPGPAELLCQLFRTQAYHAVLTAFQNFHRAAYACTLHYYFVSNEVTHRLIAKLFKPSSSSLSMPGFYTDRSIALRVWSYFFNTKVLQKLNKTTDCQNSKDAPRSSCCQTVLGCLNKQFVDNPNPEPVLPKMMSFFSFVPSDMIPG